jgi:Gnt-I system high-affinity gluconate transporter
MTFLIILFAIALQVFLTVKKLSPFLSLLIVAIVCGLLLGMQPAAVLASIEKGVGSTLGWTCIDHMSWLDPWKNTGGKWCC